MWGPSDGWCMLFQVGPFKCAVPGGKPGTGKQNQLLLFSLKAFLYLGFACLPFYSCSLFLPFPLQPPEGLSGFDLLTWVLRLDLKSSEGSLTCQS